MRAGDRVRQVAIATVLPIPGSISVLTCKKPREHPGLFACQSG